jgi:hypothetical protein
MKRARARIFDGDAHAFLVSVYRNEDLELDPRIKAAGLALAYERPRLASTTLTVRRPGDMTDEEIAAAIADTRAQAAALRGMVGSISGPVTGETRH